MSATAINGAARELAFDAIVIGGGLAGMSAALALAPRRVALISSARLGEATSSAWAQGGMAAAVGADDAPHLHARDTIAAGAGIVDRRAALRLAADAPGVVARLTARGARFDREPGGGFALGREAAHSRRRILRAGGDATGAELVRALRAAVEAAPSISTFEHARAMDVLLGDERGKARAAGAIVRLPGDELAVLRAPAVVVATGGLGGLYRFTTNPTASRGAGIALAARAGARLADLEFVQFHPTALAVDADPLPLVTEALRGEGALLIDERGGRIMAGIDPALELAPRDVVARRVFAVRANGGRVFLDARSLAAEFATHFPTVLAACRAHGIDPRVEPIPVVAAAHYHMGGIAVDVHGRTSLAGLYACGEAASSGVHGANRLASNSLLEAAVYAERVASAIAGEGEGVRAGTALYASSLDGSRRSLAEALRDCARGTEASDASWAALRETMYADVGVERTPAGLREAADAFARIELDAEAAGAFELRDAATVARGVAESALARRESRGAHMRLDFPASAASAARRSFVSLGAPGERARRQLA